MTSPAPAPPPEPPPAAFAQDCRTFFERRLRGPEEARRAVLEALARQEPHPLAWSLAAAAAGGSRAAARRAGLVVEVVRAAFHTMTAIHGGPRPSSRRARARLVLAADTLLTFAWELAADLPGPEGRAARAHLAAAAGAEGFLGRLAGDGPAPDADAEAAAFAEALRRALRGEGAG